MSGLKLYEISEAYRNLMNLLVEEGETEELKETLGDKLKQRCQEIGEPELLDKIADETQATNSEQLLEFLKSKGHPALSMDPLVG